MQSSLTLGLLALLPILMTGAARGLGQSAAPLPQRVDCPLFLPAGSAGEIKPIAGWKLYMPQEIRVTGGGLVSETPDGEGYLMPDAHKISTRAKQTITVETWTIGHPRGKTIWLYCQYGAGLQLFQPVDARSGSCTMTGTRTLGGLDELAFSCR